MEKKDSHITRRDFEKLLPPLIAGATAGAGLGGWIASRLFQIKLEEAQSVNTRLLKLTDSQEKEIAELLRREGALEVEVRKKKVELLETKMRATETAWDLREYRVEATAEAYLQDKESLKEIMSKMPRSLIHNSFRINFERFHNIKLVVGLGSGMIISNNQKGENFICLTARHVLKPVTGYQLRRLIISQPHLGSEEFIYPSNKITTYLHPERDIGIVSVNTSQQSLPTDVMESVKIEEEWKPKIGEKLFSLSFPERASRGIGFTPSVFTVVGKELGGVKVITDSLVGFGASGAPVTKADGTLVGIHIEISTLGSFILPLKDSYREMLDNIISTPTPAG